MMLEELQEKTLALTIALMQRPSVSPDDAGCQTIMSEHLRRLGFDLEPMPFGDVTNLWAVRDGGLPGPMVVFAGHTDVVPTGPEADWMYPPFEPTQADGWLYGRGSADMKSALAAMIIAAEQFLQSGGLFPGKIGFLITSDEEAAATHGTVKVMEALNQASVPIDYCIVGEPSSQTQLGDTLRVGRRGSLNAKLTVRGVAGHVAYPEKVKNPIHLAADAIKCLVEHPWDHGNDFFPPTSFQISNVHAGFGAQNVVPGKAVMDCNFRYSTASSEASIKNTTALLLDGLNLDYSIDWTLSGPPFLTQPGALIHAVEASVLAQTGLTTERSTGGGTSDGRFIAPYGIEVVELGVCNATIHQVNECVREADLGPLAAIYTDILKRLLSHHDS